MGGSSSAVACPQENPSLWFLMRLDDDDVVRALPMVMSSSVRLELYNLYTEKGRLASVSFARAGVTVTIRERIVLPNLPPEFPSCMVWLSCEIVDEGSRRPPAAAVLLLCAAAGGASLGNASLKKTEIPEFLHPDQIPLQSDIPKKHSWLVWYYLSGDGDPLMVFPEHTKHREILKRKQRYVRAMQAREDRPLYPGELNEVEDLDDPAHPLFLHADAATTELFQRQLRVFQDTLNTIPTLKHMSGLPLLDKTKTPTGGPDHPTTLRRNPGLLLDQRRHKPYDPYNHYTPTGRLTRQEANKEWEPSFVTI